MSGFWEAAAAVFTLLASIALWVWPAETDIDWRSVDMQRWRSWRDWRSL